MDPMKRHDLIQKCPHALIMLLSYLVVCCFVCSKTLVDC